MTLLLYVSFYVTSLNIPSQLSGPLQPQHWKNIFDQGLSKVGVQRLQKRSYNILAMKPLRYLKLRSKGSPELKELLRKNSP